MTAAFQHLRHELGVPMTFLRVGVLSLTLLPVAFVAGRCILPRFSRAAGSIALLGSALAFTLIISLFQLFIYDWAVWSASLLKCAFAAAGLKLAAISSLSRA